MGSISYTSHPGQQLNPAASEYIPKYLFEGFADPHGRPDVKIRDDFMGTRRKLRVGILGAGISCLNYLHHHEKSLRDVDLVVYDKNEDVGGTWLTSKYPGARSDIPSYVYQFSWRPKVWNQMYAPAEENREYLKMVARERGFYRYLKLRHEVVRAAWTDEESKWTLMVKHLGSGATFEDKVDIFLEFDGPVSNPRLTHLPGIENFKGRVIHPAHWTEDINLDGKKVALLGYGCSGVQLGPNIIDRVDKLYTWFRNKTYILPPPYQTLAAAGGANFKYSEEQKQLLSDPDVALTYRKTLEATFNGRYPYILNGGKIANEVRELVTSYMREKLASKPEILEKILPTDFGVGCRRQVMSHGYLEALVHPKTTVFTEEPQHFTERGILDDNGVEHELDYVIAATGYDQSHSFRFPKFVNGVPMDEVLAQELSPPYYLAIMLKGMPNYFNQSSAYSPAPQGNWYESSEAMAKYIVKAISKMQLDRILSINPKDEVVDHFVRHANAFLKRTAATGPCVAWYRGNDGKSRPPAIWPGARSQFLKVVEEPRFEDMEIRYEDPEDRFAFMGNGWHADVDGVAEADKTWYMGLPERRVGVDVIEKLRGTDGSVTVVAPRD